MRMRDVPLARLNTATKYPSIPTYHTLDTSNGCLLPETPPFSGDVVLTEKVDGCLTSDTRVSMADGSRKPISKIQVGEEVLGVDENGRIVPTSVTTTFNHGRADEWMKVKGRRANAGRGSAFYSIKCTPNHHFWLPEHNTYRAAEELKVGDRVLMIRSELELAPCQSSVLLGKLLGDGHLHFAKSGSASVVWGHRAADAEYVDWTLRALGDIASTSVRKLTSGYGTEMKVGRSVFHPAISERFGSMIGPDKKMIPEWVADELDPIALAFWYMDDGSLLTWEGQEDRASFATNNFTEEDCKVLLRGLARLGIDGTLAEDKRGYLTIRLGSAAAERLFLLVAPYIPPVMQRKLPERYRGHDGWLPPTGASFRELLVEQTIEEIQRDIKGVSSSRYDIETGTHNFFANGVLVHNSNARIIQFADGSWIIGSREHLLHARGDLVHNPELGIVDTLRSLADRLPTPEDGLRVLYLEVYGGQIGRAAREYTSDRSKTGYRMFDVATIPFDVLDWPRERISTWREQGGQEFYHENGLTVFSDRAHVPLTPRLGTIPAETLPTTVEGMHQLLTETLPTTRAALDDQAGGRPEGIVLRQTDRGQTAKARFSDYQRTLNKQRRGKKAA